MENKSIPQPQSSLGFFGILRESFKTTSRNANLLVPIILFVFLSISQLDFAENYLINPDTKDIVFQLVQQPSMFQKLSYDMDQIAYRGVLNDIRKLVLVKLLILTFSSVISLVFLVATVSSSSEAYSAKLLSPKDMIFKIETNWKKPLVTSFYMILITLGIICLYIISFGIATILAVNSWAYLFFGIISFSIPVCYFYLAALWMVSVVVSVLEEGFSGIKAIGRAAELMNGKRVQASLMMVLFAFAYGVVHVTANSITIYDLDWSTQLAIRIPFRNGLICLLKLFMFVVYTVFYHEMITSHDEKEVKGLYLPIASGEV